MTVTQIRLDTQTQDGTLIPSKITASLVDFTFPQNVVVTTALKVPSIDDLLSNLVLDITNKRLYAPTGEISVDFMNRILYGSDGVAQNLNFNTPGTILLGAALDAAGHEIKHIGTPSSADSAATKAYVDTTSQGLSIKTSCEAATTVNLSVTAAGSQVGKTLTATANGAFVVDGYTTLLNDRILVKNQTTQADNGIYTVTQVGDATHPYILTRATDFDNSATVKSGDFTFISAGTVNAGSGWVLTTPDPITVDTTALMFSQFSGAGSIIAGNGLTKTGNQLDVHPLDASLLTHVGDISVQKDPAGAIILTGAGIALNPGNGLSIVGNAIGIAAPISIANGGTGTTSLATAAPALVKTNGSTLSIVTPAFGVLWSTLGGTLQYASGSPYDFYGVNAAQNAVINNSINGTVNQITVTKGTPYVLSLPQNIDTGANVTFNGLTLTGSVGAVGLTTGRINPSGDSTFAIRFSNAISTVDVMFLDTTTPALNMNLHKIIQLADPTAAQHAATKNYVDTTFANQQLSNLSGTVAFNLSLLPNADNSLDLGSATSSRSIRSLYVKSGVKFVGSFGSSAITMLASGSLFGNYTISLPGSQGASGTTLQNDGSGNLTWVTVASHTVTREVPSGNVDGSNTVFNLANTPIAGSEMVFLNGSLQNVGATNDYTISGATITFNTAPTAGYVLLVTYQK
jgi:hypothetical protein